MNQLRLQHLPFLASLGLLSGVARAQNDFIVPAGQTVTYDTAQGPIEARDVIVQPGAILRIVSSPSPMHGAPEELRVRATRKIRVDGTIELSGAAGDDALRLSVNALSTNGGIGVAQGDRGGLGNPNTATWSSRGGRALGFSSRIHAYSAYGGESAYSILPFDLRRAAGGGGGAFGPDEPLPFPPTALENVGRIAFDGRDGSPGARGAESLALVPRGGAKSLSPFPDGDLTNDFYGQAIDPISGATIQGELTYLFGGRSGAGGGNSILATTFPPTVAWEDYLQQVGGGGGGGGGLAVLIAARIEIGAAGRVRADGGAGGSGENFAGLNRIGGGGGGGSGGMLVLQARVVDLTQAQAGALSALGGRGGRGANNVFDAIGAGGNGGPGLIQLHVPHGAASVQLPSGVALSDVSAPTAKLLMPDPNL